MIERTGARAKMRQLMLSGVAATLTLFAIPAHADAPDPAPTLSTDTTTHATVVTGPHHLHKVALNLNVTDWWLSGSVVDSVAGDAQLIVDAHMVSWALLEKATDATGTPLKVTPLEREPSPTFPRKVLERVAITLPRALAEKARRDGLTVTVSGTKVVAGATRAFPITVPAQAMAAFLDGYAKAGSTATVPSAAPSQAPASAVVTPTSPPAPAPQPVAPWPVTLPLAPSPPPPIMIPPPPVPIPTPPKPAPQPSTPQIPSLPTPPLVLLPGVTKMPAPGPGPSEPASADSASPSTDKSDAPAGSGIWVPSLGLEFVPTSSGAMVLTNKAGSIAAAKGIEGGDFIESADGVSIKGLSEAEMAAKIASAKVLHLIAAGDVRVR
jgi:hypothetical protein